MVKNKYVSAIVNSEYTKVFWMGVSGVLLISNVMLANFVMTATTTEKTIVTPPVVTKAFWVRGDEISKEYIEQMADYFSQQLLTYQVDTAESRFDTVLHFVDPQHYAEMKSKLGSDAERIKRNEMSSVFYSQGIHIKDKSAVITGELVGMVGEQIVSRAQKHYEIKFAYNNGVLTIESFTEVQLEPGSDIVATESSANAESTADAAPAGDNTNE